MRLRWRTFVRPLQKVVLFEFSYAVFPCHFRTGLQINLPTALLLCLSGVNSLFRFDPQPVPNNQLPIKSHCNYSMFKVYATRVLLLCLGISCHFLIFSLLLSLFFSSPPSLPSSIGVMLGPVESPGEALGTIVPTSSVCPREEHDCRHVVVVNPAGFSARWH